MGYYYADFLSTVIKNSDLFLLSNINQILVTIDRYNLVNYTL